MWFIAYIASMVGMCFTWLLVITLLIIGDALARRYATPHDGYSPADRGPFYVAEREAALARDAYTCQVCGAYPAYITHHIVPRRCGGPDSRDNLMTVCSHCHPLVETRVC